MKFTIQEVNDDEERVFGGINELRIDRDFWRAINEILFLGYVDSEYGR